ncbi:twin-arginine translocase subunit TatC [Leifsonia shinshuensis]|uniref:twin-arginine translocase subunit TatC n=1 Tax=Leifsonia shinshuensis TaxID=150026 RepID=UPI0028660556|nr:twin-arginine translocase subunit TatC [Leifsonia shinshuensis]MDR6972700.1 sec-independent protein translocase protein TatC [Leifsonia shinshuensis]
MRREAAMPIASHLAELRRRLFVSGAAILVGAVIGWLVSEPVWAFLSSPIHAFAAEHGRVAAINFDTITGAFDLRMQLAIQLGVILSAPVWLYQVFAFVVPGLTRAETRAGLLFVGLSVPLFAAGASAGVWVLPHIVELMAGFAPDSSATLVTAGGYYDFVLKLVLAVGIAFVLPAFLVILNRIGILSGSTILHAWRLAIMAIALFTAVATPAADVFSMLLLAAPMVCLYFGAAGVSIVHDRRLERRRAKEFALLP